MSEIEIVGEEIVDLDEAAPEAEVLKKKLGFAFWLCLGWLVVIVLAAIFADWLPIKDPDVNYINRDLGRPPYPPAAHTGSAPTSMPGTSSPEQSTAPESRWSSVFPRCCLAC